MLEFEFVEDRLTRDVWRRRRPLIHWFDVYEDKIEIQTWLGVKVADTGAIEIVMKAYVPAMSPKPIELRSGSCAGQSDILAAWRGMQLLEHFETNPDCCLGMDFVESALVACSRVAIDSRDRINKLSGTFMSRIDVMSRERLMTELPENLVDIVRFLIEHRSAKFSPEPFIAEYEAGILPEEDFSACVSLSEKSGPISDSFTPYLFDPGELVRLDAQRLAGKKP